MTAGQVAITATSPETAQPLFDANADGGPLVTVHVQNDAGSTAGKLLWVHVDGLHKAGEFVPMLPGEGYPFCLTSQQYKTNGITRITAYAAVALGVTANVRALSRNV